MRCYFKAYLDWENAFEALTSEEIGNLFKALFLYAKTGEKTQFSGNERFIFPLLLNSLDNDQCVYDKIVERNRQNGRKSMKKDESLEPSGTQSPPVASTGNQEKRREEKKREEKKGEEKKREEKKNIYPDFVGQEFIDTFESYADMRKSMKKPLNEHARDLVIKKLVGWSHQYNDKERYMIEVLNRSIENNWIGVFRLEEFNDGEKYKYDEDKFIDDYNAYCIDAYNKGIMWDTRMTMEEYFKEWIKENEQRSGDGGNRVPVAG